MLVSFKDTCSKFLNSQITLKYDVHLVSFDVKRSLDLLVFLLLGQPSLNNERVELICIKVADFDSVYKPRGVKILVIMTELDFKYVTKICCLKVEDVFLE